MNYVALITGAAQGVGFAIGKRLLESGYWVVITDINLAAAESAAADLDPEGKLVAAMQLNVQDKNTFASALKGTLEKFGRCDVLVNNAAMTPNTPVMEITGDEFDQVLATNLRGTFFGCQVFGAHFAEQGYGRLINMASLAGQAGGTASGVHYAASKGAILTMTKVFAKELAGNGVTCNAIAPGPVDVPSIREKVPADRLAEIIDTMIPVKKMSGGEFVADIAVMLASEAAGCVTGACWDTNGGIYMR